MAIPQSLADVVRDKIDCGVLPLDTPPKVWDGIGIGDTCTACERPIWPSQTEYEP